MALGASSLPTANLASNGGGGGSSWPFPFPKAGSPAPPPTTAPGPKGVYLPGPGGDLNYVGPSGGGPAGSGNNFLDLAHQFLPTYQAQAAPLLASLDRTRSNIRGDIGVAEGTYQDFSSFLRQGNSLDLAELGLQNKQLGIDRNAIGRDIGFANQHGDIYKAQFGNQSTELANQLRAQGRKIMDEAAAGGSLTAPGTAASAKEAYQGYSTGLESARLNLRDHMLGIKQQIAGLKDKSKGLDLLASKIGIDKKQLELKLQEGLARLGLDRYTTVRGLFDKLASANDRETEILNNIISQSMNTAGALYQPS